MSIPRAQIRLLVDTEPHAQTVATNIQTEAAGRPRHQDRFEGASVEEDSEGRGWVVTLDVRYPERAHRQALMNYIKTQVADHPQVKPWLLGVDVSVHLCTHDDPEPTPCNRSEFEVVLRRGVYRPPATEET